MKIKLTIDGYECERCKHQWMPRTKDETPITCPKCKSAYWNKERKNKLNKEADSNQPIALDNNE